MKELKEFTEYMNKGLTIGAKEYGEYNFLNKNQNQLLIDIQEECRDIANYAFMLWTKVERLRQQDEKKT